jgi:dienelactone hydrolase
MSSINARDPTLFTAAAQCHPAFLDPCDATSIRIPMCVLASGDEDTADMKGYDEKLKGEKHVETFSDMVHGWMSAKGDLEDERKKSEYERGYSILLDFFAKHLHGKAERKMEDIVPNEPPSLGCE